MRATRFGSLALLSLLAVVPLACELTVRLDRDLADVGEDAGCSICTVTGDSGDNDASAVDASSDAGLASDAHADGPDLDAGETGGG